MNPKHRLTMPPPPKSSPRFSRRGGYYNPLSSRRNATGLSQSSLLAVSESQPWSVTGVTVNSATASAASTATAVTATSKAVVKFVLQESEADDDNFDSFSSSDETESAIIVVCEGRPIRCEYCNIRIVSYESSQTCHYCRKVVCGPCARLNLIHGMMVPRGDYALVTVVAGQLIYGSEVPSECKCSTTYPTNSFDPDGWSDGCVFCYYERYKSDRLGFIKSQWNTMNTVSYQNFMLPTEWVQIDDDISSYTLATHACLTYYLLSKTLMGADVARIVYDYTGCEWYFKNLRFRIMRSFLSMCQAPAIAAIYVPKIGRCVDSRVVANPL